MAGSSRAQARSLDGLETMKENARRLKATPKLPASDRGELKSCVMVAAKERRRMNERQTPSDDRQDAVCRDAYNAAAKFQNRMGFCGIHIDKLEEAFKDMARSIEASIRQAREARL